jgi:polysaccharide export outer membrane protein
MKKNLKPGVLVTIVVLAMISTVSCVSSSMVSYFNDINELKEPVVNPRTQKIISPFDNLYIKILSIDDNTNRLFNSSEGTMSSSSNTISYVVDEKGNINFPFVGNINVGGLSISEASNKIQNALSEYVSKISVIVRFVDNKVSVLGQVENQGVYSFSQDRLNIYEALSLGGGISQYGDRKNVILMRQEGDKIMHYKLNLSDSKIAGKDYYYILPNDVIVVEPMRSISRSYNGTSFLTVIGTIASLMTVYLMFIQTRN